MAKTVIERLIAAGIVDQNVQRVVIDLQVGDVAVIHARLIGDDRLLDVVETLDGVQVVTDG